MELFYRKFGNSLRPIVIFHGLFGSSDNWLTQARLLEDEYSVYLVDQRNHGLSPKSEEFDYCILADDIREFLQSHQLTNSILVGHSMGGKAVMQFALTYPELVDAVIIVDIAPRGYDPAHDHIVEGLKSIPLETIASRNDADSILAQHVPQPDVRQFLLKNLQRKEGGGFQWKINLPVLEQKIDTIAGTILSNNIFRKPALFIRGSKSDYILEGDLEGIRRSFPTCELVTLQAGHWVQAEVPEEFVSTVKSFLQKHFVSQLH